MIKPIIILGVLVLISCGGGGNNDDKKSPKTAPVLNVIPSSNFNSSTQTYTSVQQGYVNSGGN